jgi:hypothetical protein
MDKDQDKDQNADNKPSSNDRVPGQGNSSDGLTRRLGSDLERRGEKEVEKLQKKEGIEEEHREREGSQGGSKGQA